MAQLVVPQLGESITEAVIAKWLKQVGDAVAVDEPVLDLETDKITVQLPAPVAGTLTEQAFAEGATVRVGDVVGVVGEGSGKAAERTAAPAKAAENKAAPAKAAESKAAESKAAESKAAPAKAAESKAASAKASSSASSGSASAARSTGGGASAAPSKDELLRLTPSQRHAAREHGLQARAATGSAAPAAPEREPTDLHPLDEAVKMSPLRKRIAERLVEAQRETASLTTFNEVDMTAVMELRSQYKDTFDKAHGIKLGFMSFFVKACVAAAKLFPGVNAEVVGSHIVYKKHYDFGIAVSTPKGLVVPVLRGCDDRSFAEIELGIAELAERARSAKLSLEDLTGGTFSITNGGIYGSMMSTPLLNYPQSGILGMHNIVRRAMVVGDEIKIRPMMYLALTYDHRVVDGREAVSFLVAVKERLEAPERLLFEV